MHTHRPGLAPVSGSFYLNFRTNERSLPISVNANAVDVYNALVHLATIDTIDVRRETPRKGHGFTWIVTFIDVRLPTEEGLLMDGSHYEKAFVLDDPYQTVRCIAHLPSFLLAR